MALAARVVVFVGSAWALGGCAPVALGARPSVATPPAPDACPPGAPMRVRFYDAGQALAALVELPDGRRVLVDAGEDPDRAGCRECAAWHERVLAGLRRDLAGAALDLLWLTHPHSDHLGGAKAVLQAFPVKALVDNGEDLDRRGPKGVREAASERGVPVTVVAPGRTELPLASTERVRLRAVVPDRWPHACSSHANDCSVGLRIDYCRSSVLFVGDAEADEEARLDPLGPVTLLQAGHHGSDTSSSGAFLSRITPSWAVVSAGRRGEGTNRTYCHPRKEAVRALSQAVGGSAHGVEPLEAWSGESCRGDKEGAGWESIPASTRLRTTSRDGEVVLETTGDGVFRLR
jgi:competence protein ComEC